MHKSAYWTLPTISCVLIDECFPNIGVIGEPRGQSRPVLRTRASSRRRSSVQSNVGAVRHCIYTLIMPHAGSNVMKGSILSMQTTSHSTARVDQSGEEEHTK